MSNSYDAESTVYFGYGEPDSFDVTADWTDEVWAQYDAQVAADMAAQDESDWATEQAFAYYDGEEPF